MANLQELMNEISQLQKTEEQLYKVLTRNAENIAFCQVVVLSPNLIKVGLKMSSLPRNE